MKTSHCSWNVVNVNRRTTKLVPAPGTLLILRQSYKDTRFNLSAEYELIFRIFLAPNVSIF